MAGNAAEFWATFPNDPPQLNPSRTQPKSSAYPDRRYGLCHGQSRRDLGLGARRTNHLRHLPQPLPPGAAYSATPNSVAELNQDTGLLTNLVTGMVSPHGMAFINEN